MTGALAGKTALVTGGTGAIALASARLLVRDGAAVVLLGRRKDALEAGAASSPSCKWVPTSFAMRSISTS